MTIITSLPDIDDHHHFSTRSLMTTIISSPDLWLPPSSLHQIYSVSNSSDGSSAQLRQEFQTQTVLTLVLLVHAAIFLAGIIAMLSSGSSESSSSWLPCVHVVFVHHSTILKTGVSGNILLCMVILRKRLYRQEAIGWWAWFFLHLSWLWKYNVRVKPCSTCMQGYGV